MLRKIRSSFHFLDRLHVVSLLLCFHKHFDFEKKDARLACAEASYYQYDLSTPSRATELGIQQPYPSIVTSDA